MPYFGGATLAQLLQAMRWQPPAQRTGQSLLEARDRVQADLIADCRLKIADLPFNLKSPIGNLQSRRALAGSSYVQALCWIGACLADALHYAHERGLVHLDLKPSNVLLAADDQPMLLDFHLAREPIRPGSGESPWLGGTAGYMSPEQQAALRAIEQGRSVPLPVDGRSDIYSLGVVLYEALAGTLPEWRTLETCGHSPPSPRPLHPLNSQVSPGLADVVSKCLAVDPGKRYPDMAALAADLRRHLAHLPLAGVRNRSLAERWRKWQRRRPHGVALTGMMLAVLTAVGAVAIGATNHFTQRISEARSSLKEGEMDIERGAWERAMSRLQTGLGVVQGVPFQRELADELERRLQQAEQAGIVAHRAAAARDLHRLTNRVRFLYGAGHSAAGARGLEAFCRDFWENRIRILSHLSPAGAAALDPHVRADLLDLAMIWADLQQMVSPGEKEEAAGSALAILAEAEGLFGRSPALDEERRLFGLSQTQTAPRGRPPGPQAEATAATAWEHCALGRCFLRSGNLERAARELGQAVRLEPQGLWPNFYQGLCAYRLGRYADAVAAYSVCIGAAPEPAGCFYNRALGFEALDQTEQALQDYDQALRLDPNLAVAALNRGMLHYRAKRYAAAITDLQRARELGVDPAIVAFDLALAHLACGERGAALDNLRQTLDRNPQQADARKLYDSLVGTK
jgi:tetratricopeptide (TPR) repeat protein